MLVSGRVLDCFCRLSTADAQDYDAVKEALQMRYNLTEDVFQEKFRRCAPEDGENTAMFVTRLKTYLKRWIDLAKIEKEYSELRRNNSWMTVQKTWLRIFERKDQRP